MSSFKLKIIFIAMPNSGGEDLIARFTKNYKRFAANYKLTVGVDILTKDVEFRNGELATFSIWDIGGQQRFEFIRSTFYKGAAGVILIFDLTREENYSKIRHLLTEIHQITGTRVPFVLVGSKVQLLNLRQQFNRDNIRALVRNKGGIYIEITPSSVDIIKKAFYKLTRQIESRLFD